MWKPFASLHLLSRSLVLIGCLTASLLAAQSAQDKPRSPVQVNLRQGQYPETSRALRMAIGELAQDNADAAIHYYLEAMDAYMDVKDTSAYMRTRVELALVYIDRAYYQEGINLLQEAASYYHKVDSPIIRGVVLNFIGDCHLETGEVAKGIAYVKLARDIERDHPSDILTSINKTSIAALTRNGERITGLTDTSTVILEKARSRQPNYVGLAALNSGNYHLEKKNLALALYFLSSAMARDDVRPEILRDASFYLAQYYRALNQMDKAFVYLHKYSRLNDSLLNERRQAIIHDLLIRHRLHEQEAKISELKKNASIAEYHSRAQKILTYALLLGSIIILVSAYLTIRNYQHRLNTKQIIHKQREEINQSRITELENNLKIETMQSMILGQEAERERIAKDLHDSLGGLLSTVKLHFDAIQSQSPELKEMSEYQKAYTLLDEACKEVRNISNNMQPGALLRMGVIPAINDLINRLQSDETPQIDFQHYGTNGQLDQTVVLNIYRIVQELLNNSLKHARADQILIQLIEKEDEIMVIVEDDGVGYDHEAVKQGMGTENIASRVNFLKGDLSIHSVTGEGTSTMINIPLS